MLIAEELLLLALDDESGKLATSAAGLLHYSIAGGMLLDLVFRDLIIIDRHRIKCKEDIILDDPILEDVVNEIKEATQQKSLNHWIAHISSKYKSYRNAIFERLQEDGVIGREVKKRMEIFRIVLHPFLIPEIKENLLKTLQNVLINDEEPDARTITLLSLIQGSNLIQSIFIDDFQETANQKITKMLTKNTLPTELKNAIIAVNSAMSSVIKSGSTV